MSINAISSSTTPLATSTSQANTQKTLEQRAQEGDPIAIAELKLEHPQQQNSSSSAPASEPGKGENVDKYI
jgi:inactivated superfamily I helicase